MNRILFNQNGVASLLEMVVVSGILLTSVSLVMTHHAERNETQASLLHEANERGLLDRVRSNLVNRCSAVLAGESLNPAVPVVLERSANPPLLREGPISNTTTIETIRIIPLGSPSVGTSGDRFRPAELRIEIRRESSREVQTHPLYVRYNLANRVMDCGSNSNVSAACLHMRAASGCFPWGTAITESFLASQCFRAGLDPEGCLPSGTDPGTNRFFNNYSAFNSLMTTF